MRRIIYKLRGQPEHVRRHILHVSTIIAGGILVFLWVYSLGTNFSSPDTEANIKNDFTPLSAVKENLVGGYQNFIDLQ